jgi:hypothetical protein
MVDICPVSLGFHTVQALARGRQSLPHRQVLPVFLCYPRGRAAQKIQQNRRPCIWPALCDGFLRIIIGLA